MLSISDSDILKQSRKYAVQSNILKKSKSGHSSSQMVSGVVKLLFF